ncbi:NAD-dependent epimerase/dehydratase family protein [Streptomyces sp. F8]|nr:NAD-dependent epimerase/dehydratase family protein [Streptomyces sp. F8]MDX6759518.1 NAD-dependent epimerase/dehydratase family protein [Streptomyces sp. F8]
MPVLVTGGAGFIGSHIVTALRARGHDPVVLDALLPAAHPGTPPLPDAEFGRADVRDAEAVRAARGMPRDTPYAGVASFFRSALARGEAPRVFEDGTQRRDFVHVTDVASANVVALEAVGGMAAGTLNAFITGSGEPHTVGEMATALAAAHGGPAPVVTGEFRLGDVRHITADSARLRREVGWRPVVGFAEGMAEFARSGQRASAGAVA